MKLLGRGLSIGAWGRRRPSRYLGVVPAACWQLPVLISYMVVAYASARRFELEVI